jgi:hypothetical protein
MKLPYLRMESTMARLGLEITRPVQEIEQPPADISIQQPPAELTINRIPGKLTIDQTKAREDVNLKSIFRATEDMVEEAKQDWLEGIARLSRQGDELMRIEEGGNTIAEQARENGEPPIYDFNIAFIPSHFSVKFNYEPGTLQINWKQNRPIIDVKVNKPVHYYKPGKVSGHMLQYPTLKIEVVGLDIDKKV